jgi:endonuclease/exonuclease/phosphatase family metal-dependent hydrolase
VRIATFNIRHCRGLDDVVDLERTAQVLQSLKAEVVALQEIDRNLPRSDRVDQPALLGELSGYKIFFYPTITGDGGEYGIGVATAAPVEVEVLDLPRLGAEEPRAALIVSHPQITVVSTHLTLRPGSRRLQLAAIADRIATTSGPVVVAGDLNAGRRELGPLEALGLDPGPRRATFRARQIDYVLAGGGAALEDVATVATSASDHVPLVATIGL